MMRARSDSCIFNTIALATSHDDKRIAQVAQATEATRNARVTDPSTLTFFILFFTPARPPLDVARFARLQRGRVARRPVARPPLAPLASTMEASAGEDEEPRSVRWPRCLGVAELAKPGLYQARAAFRRASAPPIPRCTPRTTPDAFSRAHAGAAGAAGQRRDADADREGLAPNHEPHGPDEAGCAVQPWAAHLASSGPCGSWFGAGPSRSASASRRWPAAPAAPARAREKASGVVPGVHRGIGGADTRRNAARA